MIRNDFVSNSSSQSFILYVKDDNAINSIIHRALKEWGRNGKEIVSRHLDKDKAIFMDGTKNSDNVEFNCSDDYLEAIKNILKSKGKYLFKIEVDYEYYDVTSMIGFWIMNLCGSKYASKVTNETNYSIIKGVF